MVNVPSSSNPTITMPPFSAGSMSRCIVHSSVSVIQPVYLQVEYATSYWILFILLTIPWMLP